MRLLVWVLRGLIFLALFALALNNQHAATLHGFFGLAWDTRMIYIVLATFAAGCAVGVLAMVPRWWRGRRAAPASSGQSALPSTRTAAARSTSSASTAPSEFGAEAALPPRDHY